MKEMSTTLTSFICQTRLKLNEDAIGALEKRFANIETRVKARKTLHKTDAWGAHVLQHNNNISGPDNRRVCE